LAALAANETAPANVPLKPKSAWRLLGRDRTGIDVKDILHGRAQYGLDVKVPGMLYASIERTRVFGGSVKSVNSTEALKIPGVKKVIEVKPIAGGINVHAGVAVLAENTWAAIAGRKVLKVEWDPGPHAGESSDGYAATMRAAVDRTGTEIVNKVG